MSYPEQPLNPIDPPDNTKPDPADADVSLDPPPGADAKIDPPDNT